MARMIILCKLVDDRRGEVTRSKRWCECQTTAYLLSIHGFAQTRPTKEC